MKNIRVSYGGTYGMCPYCGKSFRFSRTYYLPRHGFRFERGSQYPQYEHGNTQHGSCSGSGMMAQKEEVDSAITSYNSRVTQGVSTPTLPVATS